MTSQKISVAQVVILLMISRAFSVLNYIPLLSNAVEIPAMIIGNIIGGAISVVLIIPLVLFQKRNGSKDILAVAITKNRFAGMAISLVYFIIIMLNIVGTVFGFEFFMTSAIYPNASIIFLVLSIVITCFLCAKSGIEGIARASTLIFIVFLLGVLFIVVASLPWVKLINIKPILNNPANSIFKATLSDISKSVELYFLVLLLPRFKGSVKKAGIIFIVISTAFTVLVNFIIITVLGEYSYSQTFPYFSLASIVGTDVMQRLDSIHMALWVFISFVRITLSIIIAYTCIKSMFPSAKKGVTLTLMFITITVLSGIICYHPEFVKSINPSYGIVTMLLVVVVPLCCIKAKVK